VEIVRTILAQRRDPAATAYHPLPGAPAGARPATGAAGS
jgi:hypothetical protein